MASLGSLVVSLAMDTATFSSDVGKASQQMGRLAVEAGKVGAAIGAAIGGGLRVMGSLIKESIEVADATSKLGQSLGMTTEQVSRLSYAADLAGTSQEELASAIAKLSKHAADAAAGGKQATEVFTAMGVEVSKSDGTLRSTDELLGDVADRFKSYEDGAAKTALAQELFGKSGARLIPFLNQGRDGLAELAKEADMLGITLSTSAGQAAEQFNDNLTRLNAAKQGLARQIAEKLLPALSNMTDRLFDGAKNADLFGRAATVAATGVKLLISAGTLLVGIFDVIGSYMGAMAAQAVAFFSGKWAEAMRIGASANADFVGKVKGYASTISSLWDESAGKVAAKADDKGGKIAAPIVRAAEKAGKAAKEMKAQVDKVYEAIERRIAHLQLDVDTQGASERTKALIDLMRQGATGEQLQRYADLLAAQQKFKDAAEAEADAVRKRNADLQEGAKLYEETRTPLETYLEQQERLLDLLRSQAIDQETYDRAIAKRAQDYADAVGKAKDEGEDVAKSLGMSFSSAFEDAVIGGKSLGDVIKALDQDIARLIFRKMATEPVAEGATSFAKGLMGGNGSGQAFDWGGAVSSWLSQAFSGGFASGGFIPPGRWGMTGENGPEPVFGGRTGATVQPAGGGGRTYHVNVQATPGMSRQTALQQGRDIARGLQMAVARNG